MNISDVECDKKKNNVQAPFCSSSVSSKSDETESKFSHISSVHMVEEVNVADIQQQHHHNRREKVEHKNFQAQRLKITPNDCDDDYDDDYISGCSSDDNDGTLESEILELCNQIENVNDGGKTRRRRMSHDVTNKKTKLKRKEEKNYLQSGSSSTIVDEVN